MRLPNPLQVAMLLSTLTSDAPSTTEVGIALHPNGVRGKCLDVQGGKFASGTPVQIYDCNDTAAQKWVFDSCKKTVRLADTNFCLDATTGDPSNGTKMKIWQCIDNIPAQLWFRTASNQVVLFGKDVCLDLPQGHLTNGNVVQTWACQPGNTNQLWTS